jgi:hypothetical protein
METHHHPDNYPKPKKWKEYFLEFLMIFLAVTLGFVAENFREHLNDRAKEKQYIESFIHNLKDDTTSLRHVIESNIKQLKGLDSLLKLSDANMTFDSNRKLFYSYAIRYCYNSSTFRSNDATLQQLKSTGDYRLIEKANVADSLTKYESDISNLYKQGDFYETYFKEILSRLDELTDMTVLGETAFTEGKLTNDAVPQLRTEDGKLTTFFNKILTFRIITNALVENNLNPQLESSKRLIEFLKDKYDIRDEKH